ncbi:MAG TPA: hypothetical protein VF992_07810 [Thermoplasmata archaeon]
MPKPSRKPRHTTSGNEPAVRGEDDGRKNVPPAAKQTRAPRHLSDSVGMLSPEAVEAIRSAIEQSRQERKRLDRERLQKVIEAFRSPEDARVLDAARKKAGSAGLTRKKAMDLLDEVKREAWKRTYGKSSSKE